MGRRQGTEEAAQAKGIVLKGVDLETGRELFSFPLGPTIAPGLFCTCCSCCCCCDDRPRPPKPTDPTGPTVPA